MIRNECLKIVHKKIFPLSLSGFVAMAVLLSFLYINGPAIETTNAQLIDASIGLLGMLVIVPWAIVVSPAIWTDEYQYGTLKQLFLHTASRSKLYFGKVAAMVLLILTGVGCIGISTILSHLLIVLPDMEWGNPALIFYSSMSLVWQCCLYASLASLIGIWTRSAAIGVGGGLVLYFIQLIFAGGLISNSWMPVLFIYHDDLSLYWRDPLYRTEWPGVLESWSIGAVYLLVFLTIGLWFFVKERAED